MRQLVPPSPRLAKPEVRAVTATLLGVALCAGPLQAGGFLSKLGRGLGKLYQIDQALFMLGDTGSEKRLGYLLARYYQLISPISRDPEVNAWVNGIFERLKAAAPRSRYRYRIHVINSPQINAFALPGGTVFIYRGMLDFAKSDDEVACVLGHEIAHAARRHGMKRVRRNFAAQALIAKLFENSDDLQALGQVAALFTAQSYSRKNEDESDALGMKIAADAGYDPSGATTLWERMNSRFGSRKGLEGWLSSHPSHEARIQNTRKWLKQHGHSYRRTQGKSYDSESNRLVDLVPNGALDWAEGDLPVGWEVTEGERAWVDYPTASPLQGRASLAGAPPRGKSLMLRSAPIRASTFRTPRVLAARFKGLAGRPTYYLGLEHLDRKGQLLTRTWPGGRGRRIRVGEEQIARSPPLDPAQFPPGTETLRVAVYLGRITGGKVAVDEITLLPTTELERRLRELLPGGDLETDADSDGVPDGFELVHGQRDELNFSEGFAGVRLDGPAQGRHTASLLTPPVAVKMGSTYAFGVVARSDAKGVPVRIIWNGLDRRKRPVSGAPPPKQFVPGSDWRPTRDQLELRRAPGVPDLAYVRIRVEADLPAGAQLFLDDLRFEDISAVKKKAEAALRAATRSAKTAGDRRPAAASPRPPPPRTTTRAPAPTPAPPPARRAPR